MVLGNKVIRKNVFVTRAIRRLCTDGDASQGLHIMHSDLVGALHLYYGDKETPFQIIWDLIKKGTILAEKVDGGLRIYDPKLNGAAGKPRVFVPTQFRFVKLDQLGFTKIEEIGKAVALRLSKIFDYTEAALLCGGVMELHANRKMKAGKGTKVVDVSWSKLDNKIYITVYLGVKKGQIEFILYPSLDSNREKIAHTCKTALYFSNGRPKQEPYRLKEQYRENAESVIEVVTNEKGKLNFDFSDAEKLIVDYANEFDKNYCIPKDRFREILNEKVDAEMNRGVMATLIRTFTAGEAPLLTRTGKKDIRRCHVDGYMLTKHASDLIKAAHADVDEDLSTATHQKLIELLTLKRKLEKDIAALDEKVEVFARNIEDYEDRIRDLSAKRDGSIEHLQGLNLERSVVAGSLEELDAKIYATANIT